MAKTIELAHQTGTNLVGTWDHRLFCTFCDDQTISLYVEIRGDAGFYRPDKINKIETAKQFDDALKQILEITSLANDLDHREICRLIENHHSELARELQSIWIEYEEIELPSEIERKILNILKSSSIYPENMTNLIDKRNHHEKARQFLNQFYLAHGALPTGDIEVGGHKFNLSNLDC